MSVAFLTGALLTEALLPKALLTVALLTVALLLLALIPGLDPIILITAEMISFDFMSRHSDIYA